MTTKITAGHGHFFSRGDVLAQAVPDKRWWRRLWHWITFRPPPVRYKVYEITAITNTTITIDTDGEDEIERARRLT